MKTLCLLSGQSCRIFNGLKRCASKNAVLRCNQKSGKSVRFYTKRKSGGKTPQIRPSPKQNRSESQCSYIFQELMNRGKYAYMVFAFLNSTRAVKKLSFFLSFLGFADPT